MAVPDGPSAEEMIAKLERAIRLDQGFGRSLRQATEAVERDLARQRQPLSDLEIQRLQPHLDAYGSLLQSQHDLKEVERELERHEGWRKPPYEAYRDPERRRYRALKQHRSQLVERIESLGKPHEIAQEITCRLRNKAFEPEWLMDQMRHWQNRDVVEPLLNQLVEVQRQHLPRTLAASEAARRAGEPVREHWLGGADRFYGTMEQFAPFGMGEIVRSVKSMVQMARQQRSIRRDRDRGQGHSL